MLPIHTGRYIPSIHKINTAMEIIRKGTPPGERVHEGECKTCKTLIRFMEKEAKWYYGDQRDPCKELRIACPVCTATIVKSFESYQPTFYDR
jgi:hypothetical protein